MDEIPGIPLSQDDKFENLKLVYVKAIDKMFISAIPNDCDQYG